MKNFLTLLSVLILSTSFTSSMSIAHSAQAGEQPSSLTTAPAPVTVPKSDLSLPTPATPTATSTLPRIALVVPLNTVSREETVCVGDIGEITGADESTTMKLRALSLGRAAAPGQSRMISSDDVANVLRASGLISTIAITGEKSVRVTAVLEALSSDRVGEAATTAAKNFFEKVKDIVTEVDITSLPGDLKLRPGEVDLQCDMPETGLRPGNQTLKVLAFQKNRKVGEANVGLRIKIFAEVCVAAQRMNSGEILSDDAMRRERKELSALDYNHRCDASRFIGLRVKNNITAGQMLISSLFAMPHVIKKGDGVSIRIVRGNLELITRGEARGDATLDESVQVKVIDTEAIIVARACGPRAVQIDDPKEPKPMLAAKLEKP